MNMYQATIDVFLQNIQQEEQEKQVRSGLWYILADFMEDHDDPSGPLVRLTADVANAPGACERKERLLQRQLQSYQPVVPRKTVLGIPFIWVSPGSFFAGSKPGEHLHRDSHEYRFVPMYGFWMAESLLTVQQFRESGMSAAEAINLIEERGVRDRFTRMLRDYELTSVSLGNEAIPVERFEFVTRLCEILSTKQEGGTFGIPTSDMWEYACRAGTRSAFNTGDHHSYGECLRYFACYDRTSSLGHPSKRYRPNAWGFYDMHGVLFDLTTTALTGSAELWMRGGSVFTDWRNCACACRREQSDYVLSYTGIRLLYVPRLSD